MEFSLERSANYKRGEAVLRYLFGPVYIVLPHLLVMIPLIIGAKVLYFYTGFSILLKGTYPKVSMRYFKPFFNRLAAVHLSAYHMRDGYPKLFGTYERKTFVQLEEPTNINRLGVLIRFVFLPIVLLPHLVIVFIKAAIAGLLTFPTLIVVVSSGTYPERLYALQVNYLKHAMNVLGYALFLENEYPSFRLTA